MTSQTFFAARAAYHEALTVYEPIRYGYEAGTVTEATYKRACKDYDAARAAFDAAFAVEADGDLL